MSQSNFVALFILLEVDSIIVVQYVTKNLPVLAEHHFLSVTKHCAVVVGLKTLCGVLDPTLPSSKNISPKANNRFQLDFNMMNSLIEKTWDLWQLVIMVVNVMTLFFTHNQNGTYTKSKTLIRIVLYALKIYETPLAEVHIVTLQNAFILDPKLYISLLTKLGGQITHLYSRNTPSYIVRRKERSEISIRRKDLTED